MHHKIHTNFTLLAAFFASTISVMSPAAVAGPLPDLTGTQSPAAIGKVDREAVRTIVEGLATSPRSSNGTYDRSDQYGSWSSNSGSADATFCGSTREDIRNRDLDEVQYKADDRCSVDSGVLEHDPYTGRSIKFSRQQSPALEVEHIVPAEYHYDMIGQRQTQKERESFYNDPENLIMADAPSNSAKGSSGPSDWLVPDNPQYVCTYIARFSYIADKYQMPVDPADQRTMLRNIDTCDNTAEADSAPLERSASIAPGSGPYWLALAALLVIVTFTYFKLKERAKR